MVVVVVIVIVMVVVVIVVVVEDGIEAAGEAGRAVVKRQRLELREVSLVEVEAGVHDLLLDGTELGRGGVGVGELLALPAKRVGAGAGLCFYAKGGGRQDGLQHVDKLNKNNNSLSLSLSSSSRQALCLCFLAMLGARGGHVIWHADVWFSKCLRPGGLISDHHPPPEQPEIYKIKLLMVCIYRLEKIHS